MSFLQSLVEKNLIKEDQISEIKARAVEKYSGDINEALLESGIGEQELLSLRGEYLGIPAVKVTEKELTFDPLKYISEDSATHYNFVPIDLKDGVLHVGVTDPENIQAMDALQFISNKAGVPFKVFLISKGDYERTMGIYRGLTTQVEEALDILNKDEAKEQSLVDENLSDTLKNTKPNEEAKIVEDAPVIKIVAVVLRNAIEGNASDIHIEHTGEKVKVRFRVDGALYTSIVLPLNVYSGVVARIKILAKLRLDEKRKPQD